MQLGPANNALTVLSFGRPFEEIFDEIQSRPNPVGPHRGLIKVKGLVSEDVALPWFTPNPVMGRSGECSIDSEGSVTFPLRGNKELTVTNKGTTHLQVKSIASGGSGGGLRSLVDVTDSKVRNVFVPSNVFEKLPEGKFEVVVYGGRQSSDGKEIITGDTVEGDDAPQIPDDKDKEAYSRKLDVLEEAKGRDLQIIAHYYGINPKMLTHQQNDDFKTRETIKNHLAPYKAIHEKNCEILNKINKALANCTLDTALRTRPYSMGALVAPKQPHRTGKIVRQGYEAGRFYEVVEMPDGRQFTAYKD